MKLYGRITTDTGKVVGKGANKFLKFELLDENSEVVATFSVDHKDDGYGRLITLKEWVADVAGVYKE